jgi:hypothetical protein
MSPLAVVAPAVVVAARVAVVWAARLSSATAREARDRGRLAAEALAAASGPGAAAVAASVVSVAEVG